jgi:hypothetical protein
MYLTLIASWPPTHAGEMFNCNHLDCRESTPNGRFASRISPIKTKLTLACLLCQP